MGLIVDIFRSNTGDCSNNGASARVNHLCILNIEGGFAEHLPRA